MGSSASGTKVLLRAGLATAAPLARPGVGGLLGNHLCLQPPLLLWAARWVPLTQHPPALQGHRPEKATCPSAALRAAVAHWGDGVYQHGSSPSSLALSWSPEQLFLGSRARSLPQASASSPQLLLLSSPLGRGWFVYCFPLLLQGWQHPTRLSGAWGGFGALGRWRASPLAPGLPLHAGTATVRLVLPGGSR